MLAVTLTISTLVALMMFFVGGVVGWAGKRTCISNTTSLYTPRDV